MTKEEFITWIRQYDDHEDKSVLLSKLEELYEQNVVIPKGENRHPQADVLHEAIEDTRLDLEWFNFPKNEWDNDTSFRYGIEYRIKPDEPVYEWQYQYEKQTGVWAYTDHMTDGEFDSYEYDVGFKPIKDEKTKRERKL